MAISPQEAQWFADMFNRVATNMGFAVLGRPDVIRLVLTCLFAEGHVLIEDAPGTGKTALARALAASLQVEHSRIQFTPDLLPSDITGVNIFDQAEHEWEFHRGPIFASVVLADEINRASPKTQSALLEVMGESFVTVDGQRHPAPRPFMVIATQNPIEQAGTYRLPEAQLDRFLMKLSVGYPDHADAVKILAGSAQPDRSHELEPVVAHQVVLDSMERVSQNHVDEAVLDYIQRLVELTRRDETTLLGISTRGAIAMVRAARVWAAAQGRHYVLPDDVKALAHPVWTHRLVMTPDADFAGFTASDVVARALSEVAAPVARMDA